VGGVGGGGGGWGGREGRFVPGRVGVGPAVVCNGQETTETYLI